MEEKKAVMRESQSYGEDEIAYELMREQEREASTLTHTRYPI